MAEAEGIPPTASTASTGPGIRYIGQHCYAYSGLIKADQTTVRSMLEFVSGTGYLLTEFSFTMAQAVGDDILYSIYLNDILILGLINEQSGYNLNASPWRLNIPPFTKVKVTVKDLTGDNSRDTFAAMTGRVYGAD